MTTALQTEPIKFLGKDSYGMHIFKLHGKEYTAGTIEQAEISARKLARESPELMETDFILERSTLPPEAKAMLRFVQYSIIRQQDIQVLLPVIRDFDGLIEEAMTRYGRAHFLGFSSDKAELSLSDFSPECADFIRRELGVTSDQQVCIYLVG